MGPSYLERDTTRRAGLHSLDSTRGDTQLPHTSSTISTVPDPIPQIMMQCSMVQYSGCRNQEERAVKKVQTKNTTLQCSTTYITHCMINDTLSCGIVIIEINT